MTELKRLFDCLQYNLERKPLDDMLAAKEGGQWRKYSTAEVNEIVNKLSAGLLASGISCNDMTVEGRDKIAILSKNRPEWIFLDLATQQIGAVLVPIYPTAHVNDIEFVLNDAQVKMVFVNDTELFQKIQSVSNKISSLKEIYSFEQVFDCKHWKEILSKGRPEDFDLTKQIADKIKPSDLFTIIYTSGTTGTPKGVMLSHHNVVTNVLASSPCMPLEHGMKALSFLPLNHIFERMVSYIYFFNGVSIYYAESLETTAINLREVKPQMFTTVPRLLEKVYEAIMKKASELSGIKKKLFFWALDLANRYEINKKMGIVYNLQLAIANKLIFSKWREALGNNIKAIVTGSAACQVKLIRIFTAAGLPIMEGYGLTESSPVISVNRYDVKGRMFGTVGKAIPGVEVKLAEDGELLCKGPNVMMGYYKRPDITAETITDGWLHTGDIAVMSEDQFIKITDRKKEIFKTSGGKYVAPQPIENKMKESHWIEQIIVVGPERKFAGALIVPAFNVLKEWFAGQKLEYPGNDAIIKNEKVLQIFRDTVERYNQFFSQVEQIKKFELMPNEWTVDGGEMTPTLKLKRKVIMEKYRGAIERIYAS